MKKLIITLGVCMLCFGAYYLGKKSSNNAEVVTDQKYTIDYNPEDYKNITFADTARILDSIYVERNSVTSYHKALGNNSAEINLRLRIYELELKKTNNALPPNMRSDEKEFLKWLDFYYDKTVQYYETIGNKDRDDADEGWNKVSAQQDVINRIKERTESVREDYKDAVEIYSGKFE